MGLIFIRAILTNNLDQSFFRHLVLASQLIIAMLLVDHDEKMSLTVETCKGDFRLLELCLQGRDRQRCNRNVSLATDQIITQLYRG